MNEWIGAGFVLPTHDQANGFSLQEVYSLVGKTDTKHVIKIKYAYCRELWEWMAEESNLVSPGKWWVLSPCEGPRTRENMVSSRWMKLGCEEWEGSRGDMRLGRGGVLKALHSIYRRFSDGGPGRGKRHDLEQHWNRVWEEQGEKLKWRRPQCARSVKSVPVRTGRRWTNKLSRRVQMKLFLGIHPSLGTCWAPSCLSIFTHDVPLTGNVLFIHPKLPTLPQHGCSPPLLESLFRSSVCPRWSLFDLLKH